MGGLGAALLLIAAGQGGGEAPGHACAGEAPAIAAACYSGAATAMLGEADEALAAFLGSLRAQERTRPAAPDLTASALLVHARAETDLETHCRLAGAALGPEAQRAADCRLRLAMARLAQIQGDRALFAEEGTVIPASTWAAPAEETARPGTAPAQGGAECAYDGAAAAQLSCLVRRRDEESARLTGAYDALDATGLPRETVEEARQAFLAYRDAECRLIRQMTPAPSAATRAMAALPCETEAAARRKAIIRELRRRAGGVRADGPAGP